jgi:hypothetical protein
MPTSKLEVLNELLEETLRCAEEADQTAELGAFSTFVEDMLPPDVLELLYNEAGASLADIWAERYAPAPAPAPAAAAAEVEQEGDEEEEEDVEDGCCVLCYREMNLTRHHLIPREMHERIAKKTGTNKELLKHTVIMVCRMCHSTIHRFFTNKELANDYNTLELLAEDERIQKYARWASGLVPRGAMRVHR